MRPIRGAGRVAGPRRSRGTRAWGRSTQSRGRCSGARRRWRRGAARPALARSARAGTKWTRSPCRPGCSTSGGRLPGDRAGSSSASAHAPASRGNSPRAPPRPRSRRLPPRRRWRAGGARSPDARCVWGAQPKLGTRTCTGVGRVVCAHRVLHSRARRCCPDEGGDDPGILIERRTAACVTAPTGGHPPGAPVPGAGSANRGLFFVTRREAALRMFSCCSRRRGVERSWLRDHARYPRPGSGLHRSPLRVELCQEHSGLHDPETGVAVETARVRFGTRIR
jgi:hypothetical protein